MHSIEDLHVKQRRGFTLVELAIVLVIIGLIVSSVMIGQTLVKSASIRAAIQQIDAVQSGVNAFRSKYRGLPGDIYYGDASSYGLSTIASSSVTNTTGRGDGNGVLQSDLTGNSGLAQSGEPVLFWQHLKDSNLLQGSFAGLTLTSGTSITVSSYLTAYNDSKLGTGEKIMAYSSAGKNYLIITLPSAVSASTGVVTASDQLLPADVSAIDEKIDDGQPSTGLVTAVKAATSLSTSFPSVDNTCVNSTTNGYNKSATSGSCSVSFTLQG